MPRPPATMSSSPVMKSASADARKTAAAAMSSGVPQRLSAVSSRMRCWTAGSMTLDHVGADPARADRVHRHLRAERERHRLGQTVQTGLGDDVLGEAHRRRVIQPRVRRHVDDRAAPCWLDHDRGDGLRAEIRSFEVDIDGSVPVVFGGLEHALGDHDPGVVDEDVDASESVQGGRDEVRDVGAPRDVGLDRDRFAALRQLWHRRPRWALAIRETELTTTRAPSAANCSAIARPIPREAPVTIATLPSRCLSVIARTSGTGREP